MSRTSSDSCGDRKCSQQCEQNPLCRAWSYELTKRDMLSTRPWFECEGICSLFEAWTDIGTRGDSFVSAICDFWGECASGCYGCGVNWFAQNWNGGSPTSSYEQVASCAIRSDLAGEELRSEEDICKTACRERSLYAPAPPPPSPTPREMVRLGTGWCSVDGRVAGGEWRCQKFAGTPDACAAKCLQEGDNCIGYWLYRWPAKWAGTCTMFASSTDFVGDGFGTVYDHHGKGFASGPEDFVLAPRRGVGWGGVGSGKVPYPWGLECWTSKLVLSPPPPPSPVNNGRRRAGGLWLGPGDGTESQVALQEAEPARANSSRG